MTCAVCSSPQTARGAPYTHWGQQNCPANADFVYSGKMVKSHSRLPCFPLTGARPGESNIFTGNQIVSVNFASSASQKFPNIPCTVCLHRENRSSFTFLDQCPAYWSQVYSGSLLTIGRVRECVDESSFDKWTSSWTPNEYAKRTSLIMVDTTTSSSADNLRETRLSCSVCTPNSTSVAFTRWGRTSCPKGTLTKFTGLMISTSSGNSFTCKKDLDDELHAVRYPQKNDGYAVYMRAVVYDTYYKGLSRKNITELHSKQVISKLILFSILSSWQKR